MASTTSRGYVNQNEQVVIRDTGLPGTDHLQRVYVLHCALCDHVYGANGSDIHRSPVRSREGPRRKSFQIGLAHGAASWTKNKIAWSTLDERPSGKGHRDRWIALER